MSDLELRVDGAVFKGWKHVQVTRSIEQLASTFGVGSSELWTLKNEKIPLREGAICSVWIGFHRVIAGYIDTSDSDYDAGSHELQVSGRSTLCDLVDCSAVVSGGVLRNQTLQAIAETLCSPFGISVRMETTAAETFRKFGIQEGEAVLEALERAAKARGAILTDSPEGELVITTTGAARANTALEYGVNILAGKRRASWVDRFSQYTVKSQSVTSAGVKGKTANQVSATVLDSTVSRYRPLVLISEAEVDRQAAADRAAWERNTRSGKSQRLIYTVRGWLDGDEPWAPNRIVHVKDRRYGVDDDLLLVTATFTKGDRGELTDLTLTHPSAFDKAAGPPHSTMGVNFW